MTNWLEELKAGDKIFVRSCSGTTLQTVQKITPTGRVVVNNIQFIGGINKSNMWDIITLEEATEEKIKEYKIRGFIRRVFYKLKQKKSMTYEQAKKINEILGLGVQEENG